MYVIVALVFGLFIVGAIIGLIYLATRFRKFIPREKRESLGRAKSFLIGCVPVLGLVIYCIFDFVNGVVVTINVFAIWIICDLVGALLNRTVGGRKRVRKEKRAVKNVASADTDGENIDGGEGVDAIGAAEADPFNNRIYIAGVVAIVASIVYLSAGWYLAHHVIETDYTITAEKDLGVEKLRIAQIADSHVGATFDGEGFAEHMKEIQKTNPDILVIVGDYVDDDTTKADMVRCCEALGEFETTYGVYFVFGNHDKGYGNYRDFDTEDLRAELEKNNVKILEDESVLITDNIYLIGRQDKSEEQRPDGSGGSRASMETLTEGLDDSKYQIVLDHQPSDYDAQEASGVDMVLSGHTHGGQMIPVGILGELSGANDKTYGHTKREKTDFIVTSGIADWAIKYKTGTVAEYVIIDITN